MSKRTQDSPTTSQRPTRIRRPFRDVEFEYSDAESDISEEEYCEEQPVETETSSDEDMSYPPLPDDRPLPSNAASLTSKSGVVWSRNPAAQSRRPSHNIVSEFPGPKNAAANRDLSKSELFKLFITPEIVEGIIENTNTYAVLCISRKKEVDAETRDWVPVNEMEIYAFIGVLLFMGVERQKTVPIDELWISNLKYLHPPIVACMSRNRFRDTLKYIRFDNKVLKDQATAAGEVVTPMQLISSVFDKFVESCKALYQPGTVLTVDEMLVRFRGRTAYRVYMPQKPGKFGIKVWVLVDNTGFVSNLIIYKTKQGNAVDHGLATRVVMELVEPYKGSGRGVVTDQYFTSKVLSDKLLEENLTLLGTIRRNRVEIPPEMTLLAGRHQHDSKFVFHGNVTLVSYMQKRNRCVVLLSTQHRDKATSDLPNKKKQIILDYNAGKVGVDTSDQMVASYTCQRATRRWPVKIFYMMMDIAALNTFTIFTHNRSTPLGVQNSKS